MLVDLTRSEAIVIADAMREWKGDTRHCGAVRQNAHELLLRMDLVGRAMDSEKEFRKLSAELRRDPPKA